MPLHPPQPESTPSHSLETEFKESLSDSQKKWIIVVLAALMFTNTMDFMVLMPLGPKLMGLFKINPQQFSFLVSIYSFTAGIFGFLGSLIFDRLDRKHALIGVYLGFLIGTVCCALAPNYLFLLFARALSGAFGGLLSGISFAIISDVFSLKERGSAMGKLMTSFSLAAIIGVPAGLILADTIGWHAPFTSIVALGLLTLILAKRSIPNVRTHLKAHYSGLFSGVTENLRDQNAKRALLTTFLMVLSQFVVIPFISPYLVSNTGFPQSRLPLMYLLGGLLTAFSGPFVGRLCDRFSARNIFNRTGLLFLIPVFIITRIQHLNISVTLLVTTLFFILSNARMVPAMTLISSSIPSSRRGGFLSLNSCIQQLGSACASFMGGWVVSQLPGTLEISGFENTAYLSALFGLLAYLNGKRIQMIA